MNNELQKAYTAALKKFTSGQLESADKAVTKVLAQNPNHSAALCLSGLIALSRSNPERAVNLCLRAVEADSNNANGYSGLGLALRALGRLDDAEASLQRAADLNPKSAEIYNNLGAVLKSKGQLDEAARCFRQAIALKPEEGNALSSLGILLVKQKKFDEAIEIYRRVLTLKPNDAVAHNNFGVALENVGAPTEAEEHYCRAVQIKPDYVEAYGNLGLLRKTAGRLSEAEDSLLRALAIKPNNAEMQQLSGIVKKLQGRTNEAAQRFRRATALKPDYADAQFSLANAQLVLGDFENGWRGYDWRLRTTWYGGRTFEQPLWAGEDLTGKTILLCPEQGFGDVILFLRYAPLVSSRGGFPIVEVPRPLARLASTLKGRGKVIASGDPLPTFDFYCPLLSLPARFRTTVSTIPANVPYLYADPLLAERWREEITKKPDLRVGLAWAGNPKQENDRYRSIAFENLRPLFDLPGVSWFSLQVGERAKDIIVLSPESINDISGRLTDFAETAAVIANLDLVITIDSAVAHLAGALGRPVWVLFSSIPDWRYLAKQERNAWYPTLRVFPQATLGDWDSVVSDVRKALQALAGSQARANLIQQPPHKAMAQTKLGAISNESHLLHDGTPRADTATTSAQKSDRLVEQLLAEALKHFHANDVPKAEALCQQILAIQPSQIVALNMLGAAACQTERWEEGTVWFRRAVAEQLDDARSRINLGNALNKSGALSEAIQSYKKAIEIDTNCADAYNGLGIAYRKHGSLTESISNFRRAIALRNDYAEAHNGLGNTLLEQGDLEGAIGCYRRATDIDPKYVDAERNLGIALQKLGRTNEAVASYRRTLSIRPNDVGALSGLVREKHRVCDWSQYAENERTLRELIKSKSAQVDPFNFLTITLTAREQLQCARNWAAEIMVPPDEILPHAIPIRRDKIRLGYLSTDFRQHPVAVAIAELFELHDRKRFELIAYSAGVDDRSDVRRRIAASFNRFVDVRSSSDKEIAQRIYDDGIDILVDLNGYTEGSRMRVLARRPAPIQVHYLGFPATLGAPFIEYIIGDPFVVPTQEEPNFAEKLVKLPNCFFVNDSTRAIATAAPTRSEYGLPTEGFVYCCFNNPYKLTPRVFDIWMKCLAAIPGSVLWLRQGPPEMVDNLRREARSRGVAPERLVFARRCPDMSDHLARHRLANLFLDTLPYNAHTTASDALWAGLPVLTCAGMTFAGRVAGSMLRAIGLPELVTKSLDDYEVRALRLAREPSELARLRARLQRNKTTYPLFNTAKFTRHLEQAYEQMWNTWKSGLKPTSFTVAAVDQISSVSLK